MRRLGGANKRRGSVGFNEQSDIAPNRFDDDSNSGTDGWTLSFSKKRNESYSELGMTPGQDCDTFLYKNKFNRTDSETNMRDVVQSSIPKLETPNPNLASLGLQTLEEEKPSSTLTVSTDTAKTLDLDKTPLRKQEGDAGNSIFLIDFEEIESEGGKKILKPTGKKFSASSLLQSKFAQSWFFRNNDSEENDSLVEKETEAEEKHKRKISDCDDESDCRDDKKPLLSRIKSVVEKQSKQSIKHREMNVWQPQGT